jgi:membrane-bound lytic murein transglycosylase
MTGTTTPNLSMLAVAVDVEVIEGGEEAFIAASLLNCQQSVKVIYHL